jgi:Tol biopolymer transport system component
MPIPEHLRAALADRYRIERELGQGGMATVFLAQDLRHDRHVALKVLKPELAAVLGADRFVVEIKTTAALQHPHILPLFDSGTAGGFLYYVMPYVEGETLRDKLNRETQLGVDEAVRITTEVADALDYAHRHGVIHRDIKPENILLHDGRPMVADFGIALAVSAAAGGRMTETGLSLGTPHYMSPEQATADKDLTGRSDIYSLASVLYEMLSGNPPHTGSSAQQIIMKIIAEPAQPVTALRKSVPPNVAAALSRALEKLPADRFDTARAFAEALGNPNFTSAVAAGAGGGAGALARRPALTLGLAGALALALVLAAWGWLRPRPAEPVIAYGLALPAGEEPVQQLGVPPMAAPDGSFIVYVGRVQTGPGQQLWMKRRENYEATPIAGTVGANTFILSPDGKSVAFVVGQQLRMAGLAGGATMTLVPGGLQDGFGLAWLDDGTIVYPLREPNAIALWGIAPGGDKPRLIVRSDTLAAVFPQMVPGSSTLLYARCTLNFTCDEYAYDPKRDTAVQVLAGEQWVQYAPPGWLLHSAGAGSLTAVPFDLASLTTRGAAIPVLSNVSRRFTLSRAGTLILFSGGSGAGRRFRMVWVDQGGHETALDSSWTFDLTNYASNSGWALSPDGSRLAIGLSTESGDDIWVKMLPRGPLSRITFGEGSEYRPRWTPDGRSLTFGLVSGANGVFEHRADGTGTDFLLYAGFNQEAQLTPDGKWLLMRLGGSPGPGGRDILGLRLGVDTTPVPVLATRFDEEAIHISPDGRWLAYQSDETGKTEVFVRPFPRTDQGKWQLSSGGGGGAAPLWSRDGRELYYLSAAHDMMAVRVNAGAAALAPGQPRMLFHVPDDLLQMEISWYTPWDVSRDGRFIMARTVDEGAPAGRFVVVEHFLEQLRARTSR